MRRRLVIIFPLLALLSISISPEFFPNAHGFPTIVGSSVNPQSTAVTLPTGGLTYMYAAASEGSFNISSQPNLAEDLVVVNGHSAISVLIGHSTSNTGSYNANGALNPIIGGIGVTTSSFTSIPFSSIETTSVTGQFVLPSSALVVLASAASSSAQFVSISGAPFIIDSEGSTTCCSTVILAHAYLPATAFKFTVGYSPCTAPCTTGLTQLAIGVVLYIFPVLFGPPVVHVHTPPPLVEWAKTYGAAGSKYVANSVQETFNSGGERSGFILAGCKGTVNSTAWVMRLDVQGNTVWQDTYNGSSARQIRQTFDTSGHPSGFIAVGIAPNPVGGGDCVVGSLSNLGWVLRTDDSGNVLWQETIGGIGDNLINSVQQTSDGGFILAGYTSSFTPSHHAWVLRLDSSGGILWQYLYGGINDDRVFSVAQTFDSNGIPSGFIVAGFTTSFGPPECVQGILGPECFGPWVLRLDDSGHLIWQEVFLDTVTNGVQSGTPYDEAHSVVQTADGGFIVAGTTASFGTGGAWIARLNAQGGEVWQRAFGGGSANFVQQTNDGNIVAAGYTGFGAGGADEWLLKVDYATGNVLWQHTYGGTSDEYATSVDQTSDGGFVFSGATSSFGPGPQNAWIIKTDSNGNVGSFCTPDFQGQSNAVVTGNDLPPVTTTATATTTAAIVTALTGAATPSNGATASFKCFDIIATFKPPHILP